MAARIYRLIPNLEWDEVKLGEWFESRGWVFGKELEPDDEIGRSRDLVWVDPDSNTTLHLIFDQYTDVRYVAITGERAEELARKYAMEVEVFYKKEPLLATPFHAKDQEAEIRAIFFMAASAPPEYDEDYYEVFEGLLGHPEPMVRMELIAALSYPDWPELRDLVQRVYDQDPDEGVKRAAHDFLTYNELGDDSVHPNN